MLRQNVDTGVVVELANFCVTNVTTGATCYEDECVPDGSYRYGFASPYTCIPEALCAVAYWWGATVVDNGFGTSGSCTWSSGDSAPTPYPAGAPWPTTGNGVKACSASECGATSPTTLGLLGLAALAPAAIRARRKRRG